MRLPKLAPRTADVIAEAVRDIPHFHEWASDDVLTRTIATANDEGWNWEECGYRAHDAKLTPRQFWAYVKVSRLADRTVTPILDLRGVPFTYRLPLGAGRILHLIDTHLGGTIGSAFPQVVTKDDEKRYLLRSLREEAISSSVIEGATTTRRIAAEMIRTERAPKTPGERMIFNNYRTVQMLNSMRADDLTSALLCEVQDSLTRDTLEIPDGGGRFRRPEENIAVWDDESQQVLHTPTPAAELDSRVEAMCGYANAGTREPSKRDFVHPAIRAIILNFWLAYDHPFVDGNGRTARALFYWSMLRQGYWLTEYLSISSIIAGQPKKYTRAYQNTQRDENDLTYFILYHLDVIERSIEAFRAYLAAKTDEQQRLNRILRGSFNPRQVALLSRALRDPNTQFSYESHANSHGVTIYTARADILELEKLKLLKGNRKGRRFEFVPAPDIHARLKKLAGE